MSRCLICGWETFTEAAVCPNCLPDGVTNLAALDSVYPEWRKATREQLIEWLSDEVTDVIAITGEVSRVYCNLTGGLISKPNTLAEHVIAAIEAHFDKYMIDRDADTDAGRSTLISPNQQGAKPL